MLGVGVGALAVLLAARIREAVREEDVEELKDRISDNLKSLEDRLAHIAEGFEAH